MQALHAELKQKVIKTKSNNNIRKEIEDNPHYFLWDIAINKGMVVPYYQEWTAEPKEIEPNVWLNNAIYKFCGRCKEMYYKEPELEILEDEPDPDPDCACCSGEGCVCCYHDWDPEMNIFFTDTGYGNYCDIDTFFLLKLDESERESDSEK